MQQPEFTTLSLTLADQIAEVRLNRPDKSNAINEARWQELRQAFAWIDATPEARVVILSGAGKNFCAGADLKGFAGEATRNRLSPEGDGPMGPTRLLLSKPVIAAVAGYCVAGGLELACWCDLRVAEQSATVGVFCRRFGVPLIDGGTVRLPRLIGMGHAMDLILTGRKVEAAEALQMGLCNRVVPRGEGLAAALALAQQLADFPQATMRADRMSALRQWDLPLAEALHQEWERGRACLDDALQGATRFAAGAGRHGRF